MIAIAIIAFIIQNVLHEFIGHGLTAIIVGGEIISWSTAYLESDLSSVSNLSKQLVSAAGTIVNIVFGIVCFAILRLKKRKASNLDFFIWLSMVVNLLTGTGYFLFSGIIGVGDWNTVISFCNPYWTWRIILIVFGLVSYLWAIWISLSELNHYLGSDKNIKKILSFRLTFLPYLIGSIASTIGSLLNPISILFVFTSAASTFGGASGLAWMSQMYSTKLFNDIDNSAIVVKRNLSLMISSIVILLIHILIIGPGVNFY